MAADRRARGRKNCVDEQSAIAPARRRDSVLGLKWAISVQQRNSELEPVPHGARLAVCSSRKSARSPKWLDNAARRASDVGMSSILFQPTKLGSRAQQSQIVISPMTRSRAGAHFAPTEPTALYDEQRELDATYLLLAQEFSKLGIAYLHAVDHSALGAPPLPASIKQTIHQHFNGSYIASGGFDLASPEAALECKAADRIAFGRPFLANPDPVACLSRGWELAATDMSKAYTPGPEGYIDCPARSS
jgi:2,4-dienoyl-CoA reductase-like NADH-dependent reductase (Old Yellow Enzyme family)